MNLQQDETAIELTRFVLQHLPPEHVDRFDELLTRHLEHHNKQLLDQLVDYRHLAEKARRAGQQRATFFHILKGVLRDCPMSAPGVSEAMRPHLLTLRRFLEEHNAPEITEQEIREKLECLLQSPR